MEGLGSRDPCSELKGYDLQFGGALWRPCRFCGDCAGLEALGGITTISCTKRKGSGVRVRAARENTRRHSCWYLFAQFRLLGGFSQAGSNFDAIGKGSWRQDPVLLGHLYLGRHMRGCYTSGSTIKSKATRKHAYSFGT